MHNSQLSAAVIGLGRMGAQSSKRLEGKIPNGWLPISHAEAILSNKNLNLFALCDTDEQRLNEFKSLYNVPHSFTDFRELIQQIEPQFLSIATRTPGRTEIINYACERGTKVFYAEKPLCQNIEAATTTIANLKKHNCILGYGVNRRYHATYSFAKQLVESKYLGNLEHITIEHGFTNLFWSHPHSVDLILYFANSTEVAAVQANCSFREHYSFNTEFVDEDPKINNAFFKFDNGITATITQTQGLNVKLSCSKGVITILSDGESLYIQEILKTGYLSNPKFIDVPFPTPSATQNAINNLLQQYTVNATPLITMQEIEMSIKMLIGVVFSALQNGSNVTIAQIPSNLFVSGRSGSFYA